MDRTINQKMEKVIKEEILLMKRKRCRMYS